MGSAPKAVQEGPRTAVTRVAIFDDHPIVRHALYRFLEQFPQFELCAETGGTGDAMAFIEQAQPDLVILDLALQTGDGLAVTRSIRARWPDLPILILSLHHEQLFAERSIRAGASGYLMKRASPETLLEAIRTVCKGSIYVSKKMRQAILKRVSSSETPLFSTSIQDLSDREAEVFQLIGQGYTTAQIADMLGLSSKTIETHRSHIKKKLNLGSNALLIHHATRWLSERE